MVNVMVKVLQYSREVSEFELHSHYYIPLVHTAYFTIHQSCDFYHHSNAHVFLDW